MATQPPFSDSPAALHCCSLLLRCQGTAKYKPCRSRFYLELSGLGPCPWSHWRPGHVTFHSERRCVLTRFLPVTFPTIGSFFRDVGSYQKLGGQVVMWGHNCPFLFILGKALDTCWNLYGILPVLPTHLLFSVITSEWEIWCIMCSAIKLNWSNRS